MQIGEGEGFLRGLTVGETFLTSSLVQCMIDSSLKCWHTDGVCFKMPMWSVDDSVGRDWGGCQLPYIVLV